MLPYVLSIIGKEMKINFLPVLYTRTPLEEGLTPKNTHWPKPGKAYFRQYASIGWHYPTLTCDIKVNRNVKKRRYWRDLLWQVLEGLGISGRILECLRSMYHQDQACLHHPEEGAHAHFPLPHRSEVRMPLQPTPVWPLHRWPRETAECFGG